MDNRVFGVAIGATILLGGCTSGDGAKEQKKNVIVILTDDQYYNSIRALGNDQVITPNFDFLVENGVRFERHYATTSISMASRACMMSGMYEYKTGCNFMRGPMFNEIYNDTYPMIMRRSGYYAALGGKLGYAVTDHVDLTPQELSGTIELMPHESLDGWAGVGSNIQYATADNPYLEKYAEKFPHLTRALGEFGKDQIKEAVAQDKPFSISLYFKAPHGTFTPDPMFEPIYRDTIFRKPANYGEEYLKPLATQAKLGRQHLEYYGYYHGDYQNTTRRIQTLIYGVDYAIGEIRKQLEESGVADNTIIIFTSDNGYALGERALGGKVLPYEDTSGIPLIIYDPSNKNNGGKAVQTVTGNIDVTATILDYADISPTQNMDGVSLREIVENPKTAKVRESLTLMNTFGNPHIMSLSIVTDEWKYIFWPYGENIDPAEELFNVNDNWEMDNLAGNEKYADVLKEMQKLYDKQVETIRKESVQRCGYPEMATIYDRTISWEDKKGLFSEEQWKLFDYQLKMLNYDGDKTDYDAILQKNYEMDEERKAKGMVNPHTIEKKK